MPNPPSPQDAALSTRLSIPLQSDRKAYTKSDRFLSTALHWPIGHSCSLATIAWIGLTFLKSHFVNPTFDFRWGSFASRADCQLSGSSGNAHRQHCRAGWLRCHVLLALVAVVDTWTARIG